MSSILCRDGGLEIVPQSKMMVADLIRVDGLRIATVIEENIWEIHHGTILEKVSYSPDSSHNRSYLWSFFGNMLMLMSLLQSVRVSC
ncbi:hypothetical protein TorRG33x02_332110 [Trema orientale]|uniref:Uncharacterized protein n=1 Tax=Trema orientale TaxID=63057 RepID=A0A2P5B5K6_TREOI|nr:hypothetical protein TorRG33x02_332110 [Trema orientale]